MNAKQRAKIEKERQLKKQLGEVEFARQKAEEQVNEKARKLAERLVEKHSQLAVKEAVEVMQYVMAYSLNKLYGFGAVRINKIFTDMRLQMDCVREGLVTGEDIMNWCSENKIDL